jgi:polyhydroxyalkanoate synthase
MGKSPDGKDSSLAPNLAALQHKPRPLPLFLEMLRSETVGDPQRMQRALQGLRAYQEAERVPGMEPMPVIAELRGARLRDYGGDGVPLLVIPSLINPPNVLDLGPERSLLRWLAGQGHHVLLLDWGNDSLGRRDMSMADHVEQIILPLLRRFETQPSLLGYCLGGTIAAAAAAHVPLRGFATLASPWRFKGYPDEARSMLLDLWARSRPTVESLGVLPMEVLQAAFWNLDPARTVAKFETFAGFDPASREARAFVMLEDWANDGPALPEAAAREIFDSFFEADLPGANAWRVAGKIIDPALIGCPQLHIVSSTDRIAPAAAGFSSGERRAIDQGHVGMIVGGRARTGLWEPLHAWLSQLSSE